MQRCAAAAIQKQCEAGAIGAAVGEIVAGRLNDGIKILTNAEKEKIINQSKLVAGGVVVYAAALSANIAVRNNNTADIFLPNEFEAIKNGEIDPTRVSFYKANSIFLRVALYKVERQDGLK